MNDRIDRRRKAIAPLLVVRPLNLFFIALTQYLLFFHFLFPLFQQNGLLPSLYGWRAWAFIATTTLLAAAAYVINDLYDLLPDQLNKPGKWWVGNGLSPTSAIYMVIGLLLCGAASAAFIAIDLDKIHLWGIYPMVTLLIWAYSRHLKGLPFAGNLLVALLCALVAGIVWYAERDGFQNLWATHALEAKQAAFSLGFYLVFAFLATLFREVVKDCQDAHGDALADHRTLPLFWGLTPARNLALTFGVILLLALGSLVTYFGLQARWAAAFLVLILLILPLTGGMALLWKARQPEHFGSVSLIAKWVIFAGVLTILLLP